MNAMTDEIYLDFLFKTRMRRWFLLVAIRAIAPFGWVLGIYAFNQFIIPVVASFAVSSLMWVFRGLVAVIIGLPGVLIACGGPIWLSNRLYRWFNRSIMHGAGGDNVTEREWFKAQDESWFW